MKHPTADSAHAAASASAEDLDHQGNAGPAAAFFAFMRERQVELELNCRQSWRCPWEH